MHATRSQERPRYTGEKGRQRCHKSVTARRSVTTIFVLTAAEERGLLRKIRSHDDSAGGLLESKRFNNDIVVIEGNVVEADYAAFIVIQSCNSGYPQEFL